MSEVRHASWPIWQPLLAILFVSLLIREFDIDRMIAALNYDASNHKWPFERAEPWLSFYRHGIWPPTILGLAGLVIAVFGQAVMPKWLSFGSISPRRAGLFLVLMLIIGPGLVVNVGLKSLWGRPRPLQCEEFGGEMKFIPVGNWAAVRFPNSSFPSGHAAIAFFLMAPGFVVNRDQSRWWLLAGIFYGLLMGFTRVMQGGHFSSDVLWAGAIVYLVGVGLSRLMLPGNEFDRAERQVTRSVSEGG